MPDGKKGPRSPLRRQQDQAKTDAAAFGEIEREREALAAKTKRLRAQRLAREAEAEAKPGTPNAARKREPKPE